MLRLLHAGIGGGESKKRQAKLELNTCCITKNKEKRL
jgi:hypothetical protein